jgi:hypothetical protein
MASCRRTRGPSSADCGITILRGFEQNRRSDRSAQTISQRGGNHMLVITPRVVTPLFSIVVRVGFIDVDNVFRRRSDLSFRESGRQRVDV